jgi:hypothetical protein
MVLPFTEQPGKISVLTTVHPKSLGGYSPSELGISIQKKKGIVVKKSLIYPCKSAQEVTTALRNAERIIKYSEIFSEVTIPTN